MRFSSWATSNAQPSSESGTQKWRGKCSFFSGSCYKIVCGLLTAYKREDGHIAPSAACVTSSLNLSIICFLTVPLQNRSGSPPFRLTLVHTKMRLRAPALWLGGERLAQASPSKAAEREFPLPSTQFGTFGKSETEGFFKTILLHMMRLPG